MKLGDERLGRYGWWTLLVSVALSLAGGVLYAALPDSSGLFAVVAPLGLLAAIVLGVPGLIVGVQRVFKGDRNGGGGKMLLFFGPVLVFVGMELVPHLLNPCLIADADRPGQAGFCETVVYRAGFGGRGAVIEEVDVKGQFHLLHHSVVGAIPMTLLYRLALRRWNPTVLKQLRN